MDNNDYFSTDGNRKNLKAKSLRGGTFVFSSQIARFLIRLIFTAALARLLTPEDYGKIAMVSSFLAITGSIKEFGLSSVTVQRANLNHSEASNLFWINAAVSFFLMLVTCAFSPLLASFYQEPAILWVAIALSVTDFIEGLGIQHRSLLRRQMRFGQLSALEIFTLIAGNGAAVVAALLGAGIWALVISGILAPTVLTIGAWILCKWRPGKPQRLKETWSMISFGFDMTKYSVITNLAGQVDRILLGRFYGADVVGVYSRARFVLDLPKGYILQPINTVNLPALSSLQMDPIRFRDYYGKMLKMFAAIIIPVMVLLIVLCDEIVLFLLGPKWTDTVGLIQVLAVGSLLKPLLDTTGTVLVALGSSNKFWRWGLISSLVVALSAFVGALQGVMGVAIATTVATYIIAVPQLIYCFKNTSITPLYFFKIIFVPATASLIMGVLLILVREVIHLQSNTISLALFSIMGVIFYLAAWILLPDGIPQLKSYFAYAKSIIRP